MTVKELSDITGFKIVTENTPADRKIDSVYACDLLSWVIGRAYENAALVTVMTNVNVIAVAVMAELSCVILAEGVKLDPNALTKAQQNEIAVLSSELPTFETCVVLSKVLKSNENIL